MKFLSITAALSLSSQVIALPVLLDSAVTTVTDLASSVQGQVASLVAPVAAVVPRAVSSTAQGAESEVASTLTTVTSLKSEVESGLASIRMTSTLQALTSSNSSASLRCSGRQHPQRCPNRSLRPHERHRLLPNRPGCHFSGRNCRPSCWL